MAENLSRPRSFTSKMGADLLTPACTRTKVKPWTIALPAMLLAGCASYSGYGLKPGEARLDDVQALMGTPALRWQDADGSVQLAYPRGPLGFHTFMVMLGPNGRLQSIANVLEEESFARIRAGMSKEQVLRVLGPPEPSLTVYFKARDELVWDWRYCQIVGNPAHFLVLFDGTSGAVRSTMALAESSGHPGFMMGHCSR
jgi:hypothetical protein